MLTTFFKIVSFFLPSTTVTTQHPAHSNEIENVKWKTNPSTVKCKFEYIQRNPERKRKQKEERKNPGRERKKEKSPRIKNEKKEEKERSKLAHLEKGLKRPKTGF